LDPCPFLCPLAFFRIKEIAHISFWCMENFGWRDVMMKNKEWTFGIRYAQLSGWVLAILFGGWVRNSQGKSWHFWWTKGCMFVRGSQGKSRHLFGGCTWISIVGAWP
jgi:hypothetical protein